ncbi:hypothetical protein REPUB_Repub15cG0123500 [Reevesia pubescens]
MVLRKQSRNELEELRIGRLSSQDMWMDFFSNFDDSLVTVFHQGEDGINGVVEEGDEEVKLKKAFDVFDKDKDGLISVEELDTLLCSLGLKEGNKMEDGVKEVVEEGNEEVELKEAFDVFDKDKDGLISVEELGTVLCSLGLKEGNKMEDGIKEVVEEGNDEVELKEAFDVFDKDKDGLSSVEELGTVLCSLGLKEGNQMEDGIKEVVELRKEGNKMEDGIKEVVELRKEGNKMEDGIKEVVELRKEGNKMEDGKAMIKKVDMDEDGMLDFDEAETN